MMQVKTKFKLHKYVKNQATNQWSDEGVTTLDADGPTDTEIFDQIEYEGLKYEIRSKKSYIDNTGKFITEWFGSSGFGQ